jgi:hypothetical protein
MINMLNEIDQMQLTFVAAQNLLRFRLASRLIRLRRIPVEE